MVGSYDNGGNKTNEMTEIMMRYTSFHYSPQVGVKINLREPSNKSLNPIFSPKVN